MVSACLLGRPVRYDGRGRLMQSAKLTEWQAQGRLVPVCPEVDGGLPVPRPAAEIRGGTGNDVLAGRARVVTRDGDDQTDAFSAGAWAVLELALRHDCGHAILTDGSPSCGTSSIHAGAFDGTRRAGRGLTAALLASAGIRVWGEAEIDQLAAYLGETDA